jgi:hypothetical protein
MYSGWIPKRSLKNEVEGSVAVPIRNNQALISKLWPLQFLYWSLLVPKFSWYNIVEDPATKILPYY